MAACQTFDLDVWPWPNLWPWPRPLTSTSKQGKGSKQWCWNTILNIWHWTLTYDLDLQSQPSLGQGRSSYKKSRSKVKHTFSIYGHLVKKTAFIFLKDDVVVKIWSQTYKGVCFFQSFSITIMLSLTQWSTLVLWWEAESSSQWRLKILFQQALCAGK